MSIQKLSVLGLVAAAAVIVATYAQAWPTSAGRPTYLTFSGPVALPGVELPAGTYLFELAAPQSDLKIVRVSTKDRSRVITQFTRVVSRPHNVAPGQAVTFGEAPAGAPRPIVAWYPNGEEQGRAFVY